MKITHGVHCAVSQHLASIDIDELKKDLRAGPKHYLGIHATYTPSWCSEVGYHRSKSAHLHDLPTDLMFKVEQAGKRIVSKPLQLISITP